MCRVPLKKLPGYAGFGRALQRFRRTLSQAYQKLPMPSTDLRSLAQAIPGFGVCQQSSIADPRISCCKDLSVGDHNEAS